MFVKQAFWKKVPSIRPRIVNIIRHKIMVHFLVDCHRTYIKTDQIKVSFLKTVIKK